MFITFHLQKLVQKEKKMNEPIETILVRGQQKFDLHDILNPIDIEINDDRILNTLKNYKNVYYRVMPISVLFPLSVK